MLLVSIAAFVVGFSYCFGLVRWALRGEAAEYEAPEFNITFTVPTQAHEPSPAFVTPQGYQADAEIEGMVAKMPPAWNDHYPEMLENARWN